MVGTGARTRLRTHEVEPSREFLRCLPVARALSPPAEACGDADPSAQRRVVLTFPAVLCLFVVGLFFFKKLNYIKKRKDIEGYPGWCAAASVVRPESSGCAL